MHPPIQDGSPFGCEEKSILFMNRGIVCSYGSRGRRRSFSPFWFRVHVKVCVSCWADRTPVAVEEQSVRERATPIRPKCSENNPQLHSPFIPLKGSKSASNTQTARMITTISVALARVSTRAAPRNVPSATVVPRVARPCQLTGPLCHTPKAVVNSIVR